MPLKFLLNKNFPLSTWSYLRNPVQLICKRYLNQSYYDILKVPETCSTKDVRDAFINLSKENHPDKHLNDPSMHERFIRINEAYSVLINPLSRRAYDITLNHKRKLGEPPIGTREYSYNYYNVEKQEKTQSGRRSSNNSSSTNSQSSSRSNYSTSYADGDPYTWHYKSANDYTNTANAHAHAGAADLNDAYYGIAGIKRVSNKKVASIVLLFTFFAVFIQLMVIRNSFKRSRDKTVEHNRKYALVLAMAKEKVRLYGNDYQINLLKKSLKGSFEDINDMEPQDEGNSDRKGKDIVDEKNTYPINEEHPSIPVQPGREGDVKKSPTTNLAAGSSSVWNSPVTYTPHTLSHSILRLHNVAHSTPKIIPNSRMHTNSPYSKKNTQPSAKTINNDDTTSPPRLLKSSTDSSKHNPEPINSKSSSNSCPNKHPIISSSSSKNPKLYSSAAYNGTAKVQPQQSKSELTSSLSGTESCHKCKKCKRL